MDLRRLAPLLLTAACTAPEHPPGGVRVLELEATIDPGARTITFGPAYRTATRALERVPIVQDGVPGDGPPDTVELVTTRVAADLDGSGDCGFPSSFCADVAVRSFYSATLADVFVQITRITPLAGHQPYGSDPAQLGLGDTFGLWSYGELAPGADASRTWTFGDDGTAYRVHGIVWANVGPPIASGPWLAFIADRTPGTDELWAVRAGGTLGAPVRVNAPLPPGAEVTSMIWSPNGRHLAYRIGTDELFVVDMTGPVPGAARSIAGLVDPMWSPAGRYLAHLADDPLGGYRVGIVDVDQPVLSTQLAPGSLTGGLGVIEAGWSADGEWVLGAMELASYWAVHVTPAGPEPILEQAGGANEVLDAWIGPSAAELAFLVHPGASGGRRYFAIGDPYGWQAFAEAGAEETLEWTPSGAIAYRGYPAENAPFDYYLYGCDHLAIFQETPSSVGGESWALAVDGQTLAFVLYEETAGDLIRNLYVRKRGTASCWDAPELAIGDFWPAYGGAYGFGPDARTLIYQSGGIFAIDTAVAPFAELLLPGTWDVTGGVEWGRTMRVFYDRAGGALGYVDLRGGAPLPAVGLSPGFAHAAPDAITWALSPGDDHVAMRGDFSSDGVFELFTADLRGASPGAPQRVEARVGAFGWQPDVP